MPFVAPVARFAATAQSAENAGLLVDQALQAAVSAPSGVAFVDFPMDHAFSMSSDNGRPGALTELPAGPTPAGDALTGRRACFRRPSVRSSWQVPTSGGAMRRRHCCVLSRNGTFRC